MKEARNAAHAPPNESVVPQTWYRASYHGGDVKPVLVIRATAKTVVVRTEDEGKICDDRYARYSEYAAYFPSEAAAVAQLLAVAESDAREIYCQLRQADAKVTLLRDRLAELRHPRLEITDPGPPS